MYEPNPKPGIARALSNQAPHEEESSMADGEGKMGATEPQGKQNRKRTRSPLEAPAQGSRWLGARKRKQGGQGEGTASCPLEYIALSLSLSLSLRPEEGDSTVGEGSRERGRTPPLESVSCRVTLQDLFLDMNHGLS